MPSEIQERYESLHPASAELAREARSHFPNGVTHDTRKMDPFPIYMTHGQGSLKWDVDGNEYVEYKTGHGSMILGQAHPDVVKAVNDQMAKGTHLSASTRLEVAWAERVKELIPCAEKVRFHSSGTEAVMMAFRMARTYTGRSKIIKFDDHFHGWSDYAMVGASAGAAGIPSETTSTIISLPIHDIPAVERAIEQNDVAALIVESTGAHMGGEPIHPDFLHQLRDVTEKNDVVFIMDEVVTGFRASPGGAQARFGVTPDMCTLAKILAGGLPGGAVAGKAEIIDTIESGDIAHPGTFNANPLSAAAGSTALGIVATQPVNAKADAAADRLRRGLDDVFARLEIPGHTYGLASMVHTRIGISAETDEYGIVQGEVRGEPISAEADHELGMAMFNNGIDTHRRFLMAMTHEAELVDRTVEAFEKSLGEVRAAGLI